MRTAVLGTGTMGAAMARSLAREGHEVAVWNRTRERADAVAGDGVVACASVAEAVTGADVVLTMLFDVESVLAAADELVGALGPDAVWAQCSTVGPHGMRRIAHAAGAAVDRLLDTPVLGTKKPAEDGALVILASGPEAACEAAAEAFDAIGSRTLVVGDEVGSASALKLACNSWVALITAGTAQALGLAQTLGVDPQLFLDAIEGGAVDSQYAHVKGAAILAQAWDDPAFALDGVRKDVGLMIEATAGTSFDDALLVALLGVYDKASERGHGDHDMAAVRTGFDA